MIYLDYAANSPIDKEVLDTFYQASLKYFANPNSFHRLGLEANDILNQASQHILDLLNVSSKEIIYTSGATESNNLVIKGIADRYKNRGKHIILGAFEHNSITAPATTLQKQGYEVDILPVDKNGLVDLDELEFLLNDQTILVSICSVDSELGIRQPIEDIAKIIKKHSQCFFHTDASQAIGKTTIDFSQVDLITLTPHKFYGMEGFGALIKNKDVGITPLLEGGRSTTIYRSGTPFLAGVLAMEKAVELATIHHEERTKHVQYLHDMLIQAFSNYPMIHINSNRYSLPYFVNISLKNIKTDILMEKLEQHDIFISTKTSCCPKNTPSKIIYAYTHNRALSLASMRISLSHLTTQEEITSFLKIFDRCMKE